MSVLLVMLGLSGPALAAPEGPADDDAATVVAAEPGPEPLTAARKAPAPVYRLGAGDTLDIDVYGEPTLSREVAIPASCRVQMPLVGGIEVCDITAEQAAERIRARYADGYLVEPAVFVDVAAYGSQRVEVKGAVKSPGVHLLTGPTTLSEIITRAGGPESPNVIRVEHVTDAGKRTYDLTELDAREDPVWVRAGETVNLLPPVTVQVFGEVEEAGPVAYEAGMTVTEALGLAGGATQFAGLGRAYILRSDGQTRERVNIRRIQQGKDPDPALEPNDQLVVRKSIF